MSEHPGRDDATAQRSAQTGGAAHGSYLTPTDVQHLLAGHGLAPRKADGQNFLVDANVVRKIVRDADVGADDVVVEIGAGFGSLTLELSRHARRVVAVEIDRGIVAALRDVVGQARAGNVSVVHADVLRLDLAELTGGEPFRVVSNLPYSVATPILFHVLDCPAASDLFVMVQREVGERWAARPGDDLYSGVSIKVALAARVDIVAQVSRHVFTPQPRVDSVTVRVVRRTDGICDEERAAVSRVVDTAFLQRRKTLRNALSSLGPRSDIVRACEIADIDATARAEELTPDDFRALTHALRDVVPEFPDQAAS